MVNQWTVRVRNDNWERLSTRDMMRAAHRYLEEDCGLVVVEYKGSPESGIYRFTVKGNDMGIELVVLYCVYAIVGGVVVNTTVSVTGDVLVASREANATKYVACMGNQHSTSEKCKGLE